MRKLKQESKNNPLREAAYPIKSRETAKKGLSKDDVKSFFGKFPTVTDRLE
jgi:hypothetical protein